MDARKNLYRAIYNLLQVHSIEQITVDMILEESDVSRATFYRHFKDKYDLMNWYYGSFINKNLLNSEKSWDEIIYQSALFMYDRKPFFQNAVKYRGQNSFSDFLHQYYREFCVKAYKDRNQIKDIPQEISFAIDYHCAGAVQVFSSWVESGMELHPKDLTALFYRYMPEVLRKGLK